MKTLILLLAASFASAAPSAAPAKPLMEKLAAEYLAAFDAQDEARLNKVVTDEYFVMAGGREGLRARWKKIAKGEKRRVEKVEVRPGEVGAYIRFDIKGGGTQSSESMGDHEWFHVVQVGDAWRIDRPESDFAPEE